MTEYAFEGPKRSTTAITWSFETQTFASDASTPFSNPLGSAYQSTIQAAFDRWASVSGLSFTQVADAQSVQIRIGFGSFPLATELGETDYRFAGKQIAADTVVRLVDPAGTALQLDDQGKYAYTGYGVTLYQVVLHELGHALGLAHTTDPATEMYPYASTSNPDLAFGDIEGINTLYPYYSVVATNPVQVEGSPGTTTTYSYVITRHGDPTLPLTINYQLTGAAYPGLAGSVAASAADFPGGAFPSGQLAFALGSTTATLSVTVLGSATAQPDQGFALMLTSTSPTDSVTVRGSLNGMILDTTGYGQISGNTLGIFRFFDTADGTHFYTASEQERNTLIQTRTDLTYEGIDLNAVANPGGDPAAAPVFRFFDTRSGTHFYSISTAERDTILATRADLTFEGTSFYEHAAAQAGDAPVFRFFDLLDGTHFYTASTTERATILATRSDLRDEGIGFYAPSPA